jgi:cardiolipin synthase (CMP-forming)
VAERPVAEAAERARLTFRRLSGLDRSGPPPPETVKGAPLRPWTIPNAIGFIRLAGIPAFLIIAFNTDDGQYWVSTLIFGLVGWGDYFDGIAARVTRQYSRMGALLDPLIDRLLVLSGVIVCWHFELLPRWALALLAAREVFMLGLVRWALHHDLDIKVNWLGRLGVWPVLSAPFFAMAGLETVGAIFLYIGLAFALTSTAKYLRDGLAARPSSSA